MYKFTVCSKEGKTEITKPIYLAKYGGLHI